ncbi:MAG: sulfatase [Microbacterium sp.]
MNDRGSVRPNVILIVVDDLGWTDLGVQGSTFYETPVIDAMAAQGCVLTQAYAASPVCSPTRASLLTGRYPLTVGVTQLIGGHGVGMLADVPSRWMLPTQEYTLARALRSAGYQTWHVGKWHLGPRRCWPDQHGFDVNIAGCDWGLPRSYFSPYECPTLTDGPEGEYLTDRLTSEAIRLIENADDEPFFLNLWHYAVHIPLQAPAALVEKYERKRRELGLDRIDPFEEGEEFPVWHLRDERIRRRVVQSDPVYAAMIENLDSNTGRLLDVLERKGIAENTIVVFTSDNGGLATAEGSPTSNLPLREGKGWMQEGGVRVPFVVRWPARVPAGVVSHVPLISPDVFPTILAAAGVPVPYPSEIDGEDVFAAWCGKRVERGPLLFHYPHYSNHGGRPSSAVREGRFKLTIDWEDGTEELFDVVEDPGETRDLRAGEPERAERMSVLLREWVSAYPWSVPLRNPRNEPYDDLIGRSLYAPVGVHGPRGDDDE